MKQIIWSSDYLFDDKAREDYVNAKRDILDDEDYTVSDADWAEVIDNYLSDERMNLDRQIDGVVMAFADLGLWNGRRQGYKILGHNINGIFNVSEEMIYNREIDEAGFRKKTRSLYPYVAKIYGWKTGRFGAAFNKAV